MNNKETIDQKLNRLLANEPVVNFTYKKINGEIRHARGTKRMDVIKEIDEEMVPQGDRKCTDTVIRYFDLDKENWRTVCKSRIISIETVEPLDMFI